VTFWTISWYACSTFWRTLSCRDTRLDVLPGELQDAIIAQARVQMLVLAK